MTNLPLPPPQADPVPDLQEGRLSGLHTVQHWREILRRVCADDDVVAATQHRAQRVAEGCDVAFGVTLVSGALVAVVGFNALVSVGGVAGVVAAVILVASLLFALHRMRTRSVRAWRVLVDRRVSAVLPRLAAAILERLVADVAPDQLLDLEIEGTLVAIGLDGADGARLELNINDLIETDGDRRKRQIDVRLVAAHRGGEVRIDRVLKSRDNYPLFNTGVLPMAAASRMVDDVFVVVEAARSQLECRAFQSSLGPPVLVKHEGVPTAAMVKSNRFGGRATASSWVAFLDAHHEQLGAGRNLLPLAIVVVATVAAGFSTPLLVIPAFVIFAVLNGIDRGPEALTLLKPLASDVLERFGPDVELTIDLNLQQRPSAWSRLRSAQNGELPRERTVLAAEIMLGHNRVREPVGIKILVADVERTTKLSASVDGVGKAKTQRVRLLRATTFGDGEPVTRAARVKRPKQLGFLAAASHEASGAPELIEMLAACPVLQRAVVDSSPAR